MSLVDDFMTDCVLMEKTRVPDGRGGWINQWKDGAVFQAAIEYNNTAPVKAALSQGAKEVIDVTTQKELVLDFHDVFRRLSDGQIYRVTDRGENNKTPNRSTLDMRKVSAEEYELTGYGDGNG